MCLPFTADQGFHSAKGLLEDGIGQGGANGPEKLRHIRQPLHLVDSGLEPHLQFVDLTHKTGLRRLSFFILIAEGEQCLPTRQSPQNTSKPLPFPALFFDGVYPIVEVTIDGKSAGSVALSGGDWETYSLVARLERGKRKLSIAFTNDGGNRLKREDRNLFVDRVLLAPHKGDGVAYLSTPPAIATVRRGDGRIVFDQLRWDSEDRNGRKAARYACSLLTALDADFAPRAGATVECEKMTPQPGMGHYDARGTHASMACNGHIETPIEVAASGRYTIELIASGTPAADEFPLVEVRLDGKPVGRLQLASGGWRSYWLDLNLTAGPHNLQLAFINDLNRSGQDRNLRLDKVVFYRH